MITLTKEIIVLSESGLPLENVHVVSADNIGTITDQNGRATVKTFFALNNIRISHIGYKIENTLFASLPDVIYLQSETESLDEVVIIASKPKVEAPETPKEKTKTPWYVWAGLGISVLGLLATLGSNNSTESVGLSKPQRKKPKKKKSVSVTL